MSYAFNVPAFTILFTMLAAIFTSITKGETARRITLGIVTLDILMSIWLMVYLGQTGEAFVYVMGHIGAPWGNELRAGMLEAGIALLFSLVTLFALLGGGAEAKRDLKESRVRLFYIMIDLSLAANLALVYTNDIFTSYVFIEISTLTACGLIIAKFDDFTITAAVRYMIMSLVGSGLVLLGICFLYDMTGHLLMGNMREAIDTIVANGQYNGAFIVTIALITVGLAIKSALWPFHAWLPNAYGHSTPTTQVVLSSIVSKGYIFLLVKIIYRVIGFENFRATGMTNLLFVFGIIGMILGSVNAIKQTNVQKIVAYSSVAQIGYIYMGIGVGVELGMAAGAYHIFAHSTAKALAFVAISGLIRVSNGKSQLTDVISAGYRNKLAGFGFVMASLSMIGIPGFAGFASKLMFARSAFAASSYAYMLPILIALAISTALNAIYFMHVMIRIYTPVEEAPPEIQTMSAEGTDTRPNSTGYVIAVVGLTVMNLMLGIFMSPTLQVIQTGLTMLG